MSKFLGKISAGVGNSVEITKLSIVVENLVKTCEEEFTKFAAAEELTVDQATQIEKDTFEKLLAQYDKKAASICGKSVPENWNTRGEGAPKANSAVRKRMLFRELEKRSGQLHPMFLACREATIKSVTDAFNEAKRDAEAYYAEIQGTLPMQPDHLTALITRKHDESVAKALKDARGLENIDKVVRIVGDKAVTFEMFRASLRKFEDEILQQNGQLIAQAKAVEFEKVENAIYEAIRTSLEALAAEQEKKRFDDSEYTFLSPAEKSQFEKLLVETIRDKQGALVKKSL